LEEPGASWAFSFEFHKSKTNKERKKEEGEDALQ
jgi:hypothetical protein